jgi:hypothetical protein
MKYKVLSLFLILNIAAIAQSKVKGDRNVTIISTDIDEFNTLSIGDDFEVLLIKDNTPSVTLETDDNLHAVINFAVKDSILNFNLMADITRAKDLKAIIRYTDNLKSLVLNGDVKVKAQSGITLPHLNVALNEDAEIEADINTDTFTLINNHDSSIKFYSNCKLTIECNSAILDLKQNSRNEIVMKSEALEINAYENSKLDIEGYSFDVKVNATQSSEVKAKNLIAKTGKLISRDKSSVEVNTSDSLSIDAAGNSKIYIHGQPKISIEELLDNVIIYKK